jgi:osmoprotectant transport system permease protein
MRRGQAERLGIRTIADLAAHAPDLTIGGDYEFFNRPEWRAVRSAYGLRFADHVVYDPTFLYESAARGDVDVISAFTTDGRIEAYDLMVLADPRGAIPPYDALLLLSPQAAAHPGVAEALKPLVGAIDAASMRAANARVDRDEDKQSIAAAAAFLDAQLPAPRTGR